MTCRCGHGRLDHRGNDNRGPCEACDELSENPQSIVEWCERYRDARPWWRRGWPISARIGLEFESLNVFDMWWRPYFHAWHWGFRVGVLGLHVIIGVRFDSD